MPLTRLRAGALPGGDYGPFAGKGAGGHPVGTLTALHAGAIAGRRYGSFAGRAPAARRRLTALHAGVLSGRRYGSFAGRVPAVVPEPVPAPGGGGGGGGHVLRPRHRPYPHRPLTPGERRRERRRELARGVPAVARVSPAWLPEAVVPRATAGATARPEAAVMPEAVVPTATGAELGSGQTVLELLGVL
jgi:hypothetical protein